MSYLCPYQRAHGANGALDIFEDPYFHHGKLKKSQSHESVTAWQF